MESIRGSAPPSAGRISLRVTAGPRHKSYHARGSACKRKTLWSGRRAIDASTLGPFQGLRHCLNKHSYYCGMSAWKSTRDNERQLIEIRLVNHPRAIALERIPVITATAATCALCYTNRTGPGSQRSMSARPLLRVRQSVATRKIALWRLRFQLFIHNV